MSQAPKVKPYRWLAQYYDELFSPSRAPIDAVRQHVLGPILPKVRTACDLACGTGTTALALARMGMNVYAIDLSPHMCRLAREKAAQTSVSIHVLQADMREFRLPEAVDLITCEADALNHVPHRTDLRKVLQAMARALRPGGYAFFDVNNALGFKRYWSGEVRLEKPDVTAVMRNGHSPRAERAWSDIEWRIRDGAHWRRHHEHIEEVCWTAEEIRCALRDAGFDRIRCWDEAHFFTDSPVRRRCRTAYLARKSPQAGAPKAGAPRSRS